MHFKWRRVGQGHFAFRHFGEKILVSTQFDLISEGLIRYNDTETSAMVTAKNACPSTASPLFIDLEPRMSRQNILPCRSDSRGYTPGSFPDIHRFMNVDNAIPLPLWNYFGRLDQTLRGLV